MEQEPDRTLDELLGELGQLSQQYQTLIAPYQAQIKNIEIAREDATMALTFQMETLEAVLRPLLLATKETRKVPYITAIYQRRDKWDRDMLFSMAKEVPAIMQAYTNASCIQFRKTAR